MNFSPFANPQASRVANVCRPGVSSLWLAALVCLRATSAADGGSAPDRLATDQGELVIHPIQHATLALEWNRQTIYVDPVGGATRFAAVPRPDLILITDLHGDHLEAATLKAVATDKTLVVAPPACVEKLPAELRPRTTVLSNTMAQTISGIRVEAVAAYNVTPERLNYHAKGRGNGYVLTLGGKRVYVSGDTEATPELQSLKNIDVAFVCMNLPYTMDVEQAAKAIAAFRPKVVYPYHSRGSNLKKLRQLLADTPGVEVRIRDWYP